jgi:DNA primase
MGIPDSKISEIAAAADIVQVVSDYVDLKKAGKDYRGLCPFHGEKDPSFYVSPQKGIFYCFGCAAGGSVFNFIMKMENISFVDSVKKLARRYGVPFDFDHHSKRATDEKEGILKILGSAQTYFREELKVSRAATEYLEQRGLSPEWIASLGLGFAPDTWDGVLNHLRRSGADMGAAVSAGLLKQRAGGGYYDYFRSRIMIPIQDLNGSIVAFGGRILGDGDPKYLNSPESLVFSKKRLLYGLDSARDAIRKDGFIVLVEGYFDQITLRRCGMANAAAPLGTALGREQVRLLKRFSREAITVFDGDEAGIRAVKRAIPLFFSEGLDPRCLILRQDKDPDEAVRRLGIDGFRKLLDTAVPMVDFLLDCLVKEYDLGTVSGRNCAIEESLPVLREVADSTERDYLLERFSSRIRVREARLRALLESEHRAVRQQLEAKNHNSKKFFDLPADERNVVRGMMLREGFIARVIESGVVKDLEEPVLRLLAERMIQYQQDRGVFDPASFCSSVEEEDLASMVAGWLQPRPEEDDLRPEVDGDRALDHSLDSIRLRKLQRRKSEIQERMNRCTPGEEEYNRLAQELRAIGQRLRK